MTSLEETAFGFLTPEIANEAKRCALRLGLEINEIRLRENRLLSITCAGKNFSCDRKCTSEDIALTVDKLCGGSLYSHADDIRNGVINTEYGIRAGVCGRAVCENGKISAVCDISSVNIRIPRRVEGAGDGLFKLVKNGKSALVFSPPGVGKTTVLRELIPYLARENRVAVIDTRYELCAGISGMDLCDVFSGYPRFEGIKSAVRTMSPEYIICDEIAGRDDAEALLSAYASGIAVCASAHAADYSGLLKKKEIAELIDEGVFDYVCALSRSGLTVCMDKDE